MSEQRYVLVAHMGHNAPWLQIKTRKEVKDRIAHIKAKKPERERPLRLKLLKIVKEPLPSRLAKAYAAWVKTSAAWVKADATWDKANVAWYKDYAARGKANAAWVKAYAAWVKANDARDKANAAWGKANAAWEKTINSPASVKFHKQVCGCAWTPEQPDILMQLEEQK